MLLLLLCFAILQIVHGSCPDGFDLVRNGQCRGKYTTITKQWDDLSDASIAKCNEIAGKPVIIHDAEDQTYWSSQISSKHEMVLGLVCNSRRGKWEWSDGSALDYKPPKGQYSAELDRSCRDRCSWLLDGTGYWTHGCGHTSKKVDVFCTTLLELPTPSGNGCESFEDDSEDGVCYQIGATAQNWRDAQRICRNFGADLAPIHSQTANSFIRRLAVSKSQVNGLFLGALSSSGKDDQFEWIDGSDWDYNNFYPGFPISEKGNCLAMDTQGTTGQWVNTDCSSKHSVACVRPQHYEVPSCSSGPWREGDIIYTPGFPFDASTPCDFMLTVDDGKNVEVEILLLEANSCCDHLVLFDDYISGNVIANLTGEVNDKFYSTTSSNFMRVSWQPHGGANVRGMMMTFRAV